MNQLILPSSQNFEEKRKTVYIFGRPVSHSFPQFDIPFLLVFLRHMLWVLSSAQENATTSKEMKRLNGIQCEQQQFLSFSQNVTLTRDVKDETL